MVNINSAPNEKKSIRLHLTNIEGLGAVRLIQSLLPNLISQNEFIVEKLYVPENKNVLDGCVFDDRTKIIAYKRYLPRPVSRFLECTIFGSVFNGCTPLLVLGDLPIRCKGKQVVFLQNTLLLNQPTYGNKSSFIKYLILRFIFKKNMKYVNSFIVQTSAMKDQLISSYPSLKQPVHIISQPVPAWLTESNVRLKKCAFDHNKGLKLFYPAAFYPHKNHKLLADIYNSEVWPVDVLTLTIMDYSNPKRKAKWINCKGTLTPEMVINEYRFADALLFLSHTESYGFPLIESMWAGLPIICPDLVYARNLCGDQAIYFNPLSVESLYSAVNELNKRLNSGWRPDWTDQLTDTPSDWAFVARMMAEVTLLNRPL